MLTREIFVISREIFVISEGVIKENMSQNTRDTTEVVSEDEGAMVSIEGAKVVLLNDNCTFFL